MTNLILVRHGQSIWNKEKRFTGWMDVDLTEKGESEAKLAGQLIKELDIEFHTCFTSCLRRAEKSLKIILEVIDKKNIEIIKSEALNERHYGGLTSLNKEETIKKYGDKQVEIWRRSYDVPPPNGESLKMTYERSVPYYKDVICSNFKNSNIIISAHGNSIRAIIKYLFNYSNSEILKTFAILSIY